MAVTTLYTLGHRASLLCVPRSGTRCQTISELNRIVTVFAGTWRLFCSLITSVFSALEMSYDNALYKSVLHYITEDWKRPRGCPRITWMKTVLNDLDLSPTISRWLKQSTWLRITRSGDCWVQVVLCTHSGAGQKWWWWWWWHVDSEIKSMFVMSPV